MRGRLAIGRGDWRSHLRDQFLSMVIGDRICGISFCQYCHFLCWANTYYTFAVVRRGGAAPHHSNISAGAAQPPPHPHRAKGICPEQILSFSGPTRWPLNLAIAGGSKAKTPTA